MKSVRWDRGPGVFIELPGMWIDVANDPFRRVGYSGCGHVLLVDPPPMSRRAVDPRDLPRECPECERMYSEEVPHA